MPHLLTSKGQGAPQQNGVHGSDHPCRPAHKLGIINHLCPESKWQAMSVFRSPWPQWGHLLWSPQGAHCVGICPWVHTLCYFIRLDAHHGYWSIVLDQKSSLLTTFNSPFGRYHFLFLPFGLVCSHDIFQKKMDQILEECPGYIGITDDITAHVHIKMEYDAHLQNLMHVSWNLG